MNPTTKRVLMNHMTKKQEEEKRREEEERRRYGMSGRYDADKNRGFGSAGEEDGSGYHEMVEDRFRDRRGREHYDNGRYAPMNLGYMRMGDEHYPDASRYPGMKGYGGKVVRNEDKDWVESRQRRDSRRRYTSPRSEYDGDHSTESYYPDWPYVPPVYERERGTRRTDMREDYRPMNKIGFALEGEMERVPNEAHHDYKTNAGYEHTDEMAYRKGSERSAGHGSGNGYAPLTKQMAIEWAEKMENVDGTKGPHWTMEQVKQVMAQKNIECPVDAFFLAINAMYSDYSRIAKELGVNTLDFYVKMAKAFLDDPDGPGPEEKIAKYYEYVVH